MRSGSLAQMLLPFRDSGPATVTLVRSSLLAAKTTGAIFSPAGPSLWFYGPGCDFQRLEDVPAIDRVAPDSLWYVRPAKAPKAVDTARELLDLGCTPSQAVCLTGCHKSLLYRDLADRAERGVCPCCHRAFKPGSAAALA